MAAVSCAAIALRKCVQKVARDVSAEVAVDDVPARDATYAAELSAALVGFGSLERHALNANRRDATSAAAGKARDDPIRSTRH